MYILLPEFCLRGSKEDLELAEVVRPDDDLLLFCSETGLVKVSSVWLWLGIGTIYLKSTEKTIAVWTSIGEPRALVRFEVRTSVGSVKLRSH